MTAPVLGAAQVLDPRVAAVEQNLLEQLEHFAAAPGMRRLAIEGVTAYCSNIPFPLFNAIGAARFADDPDVSVRTGAVVRRFVRHGMPFLWWPTPSSTSTALEDTLLAHGLEAEEVTGMYADLTDAVAVEAPVGARLVFDPPLRLFAEAMVEAFAMPTAIVDALAALTAALPRTRLRNLMLLEHDRLLGCGSLYLSESPSGTVAGLYNIATVEQVRGRGVGRALTALLLNLGRDLGATRAVLHATPMGRPVYRRLGFVDVCSMPQYLWLPPEV
jgi:GNAT superfamily N-acetyltransferase